LSRRLDPEVLYEVISAHQQTCTEPIEQYGGYIARYIGDGILSYFGYPLAHEDDAERAVRAGLGIVDAIAKLNARWQAETLAVRIGICTGEVVVGYVVGKGAAEESAVAGEAANLTAKLQQLARPNTVTVSDTTKELTGNRFEYCEGGNSRIAGYDKPVRYWFVTRETTDGRSEGVTRPLAAFVGRRAEIATLLRQWDSAAAGRGRVSLVRPVLGLRQPAEDLPSGTRLKGVGYHPNKCKARPWAATISVNGRTISVARQAARTD
jgi:class 3 adenylate cyclase